MSRSYSRIIFIALTDTLAARSEAPIVVQYYAQFHTSQLTDWSRWHTRLAPSRFRSVRLYASRDRT